MSEQHMAAVRAQQLSVAPIIEWHCQPLLIPLKRDGFTGCQRSNGSALSLDLRCRVPVSEPSLDQVGGGPARVRAILPIVAPHTGLCRLNSLPFRLPLISGL